MPMYEYLCEANGLYVEVVHKMSERYETWGELCENAKLELGDTPADAAVQRLIGGGNVNNKNDTLGKIQSAHADRSRWLKSGPTAAPMRGNRW